jgi:hypothetical protein
MNKRSINTALLPLCHQDGNRSKLPLSFLKKPHSACPTHVADHLVPNQVLGFFEFFRERERGRFLFSKACKSLYRRRFKVFEDAPLAACKYHPDNLARVLALNEMFIRFFHAHRSILQSIHGASFVSFVLLTIRFKPIREEFLIVALNSPHPPKLLCVLCVEVLILTF